MATGHACIPGHKIHNSVHGYKEKIYTHTYLLRISVQASDELLSTNISAIIHSLVFKFPQEALVLPQVSMMVPLKVVSTKEKHLQDTAVIPAAHWKRAGAPQTEELPC